MPLRVSLINFSHSNLDAPPPPSKKCLHNKSMPRTFKGRRFRKRRVTRKSKRMALIRRGRAMIGRKHRATPIGGFPRSKLVKLRYVDQITINPASGINGVHVFSANGMYDPDVTGIGHQPANFDKWMKNYDHYTVVGSKIRVMYTPSITTTVIPGMFGVLLSDDGNTVGSLTQNSLLEQPRLSYSKKVVGIPSANSVPATVTKKFSARKFFGVKPVGGGKTFQGSDAANPTEQAFYEVWVAPILANDPGAMYFTVTIDYLAVLTEPQLSEAS